MPIIKSFKGKYPKIADDAFIADDVVIIGDVEIGSKASIWYGCVIRGDVNYIKIGKGTNIQDDSVIHVSRYNGPTIIGDGVTVGHKVLLHACTLEDYSFAGMGSILLDGSKIEKHGMLAAGALLTPNKTIPSGQLWAGSPAKLLRDMRSDEIEYIYTSERNYIILGQEHKKLYTPLI
ncbi:MAG: transferase, hexapeptide repeat family protein [Candidatus Midichloriaceae bacterium]|jgi:carbonic anhydrase/acetyltransferase-like protein (isoleucine patch superfamily)|nr:transferase, hexapeptide repeat family protein [Candidatus Midichloriaceae bacterium]